jgi:hypothetical protein
VGHYQVWDPATSTFDVGGHLLDRPASATVTRLTDGRLLLVGGVIRGGLLADSVMDFVFLMDPDRGAPDAITRLSVARFNHAAVLLPDDRVLVLGGDTNDMTSTATASVEVFDPTTKSFSPAVPLHRPIREPNALLLGDGRVLIIDDRGPGPSTIDVYDPEPR